MNFTPPLAKNAAADTEIREKRRISKNADSLFWLIETDPGSCDKIHSYTKPPHCRCSYNVPDQDEDMTSITRIRWSTD